MLMEEEECLTPRQPRRLRPTTNTLIASHLIPAKDLQSLNTFLLDGVTSCLNAYLSFPIYFDPSLPVLL